MLTSTRSSETHTCLLDLDANKFSNDLNMLYVDLNILNVFANKLNNDLNMLDLDVCAPDDDDILDVYVHMLNRSLDLSNFPELVHGLLCNWRGSTTAHLEVVVVVHRPFKIHHFPELIDCLLQADSLDGPS